MSGVGSSENSDLSSDQKDSTVTRSDELVPETEDSKDTKLTVEDKVVSRDSIVLEDKQLNNDGNYEYLPSGEYVVDRHKPETFLNSEDLEKVTESDVFPQKRLFSFLHSRKIPEVPVTDDERTTFPLFRANIISQMFIWWVYPIIRVGYKRTIQPNDLFKMDDRMAIETLYRDFEKNMDYYFTKHRNLYRKNHPNASENEVLEKTKLPRGTVLKALFFTFKYQYSLAVLFAILANCTSGFNPLLTKRLINFVEQKALYPSLHVNPGIGYAIGSCIMLSLNGIFFNQFFNASQLTGVQVKALLTRAALTKMFRANGYTKHKFPNGKVTSFVTTDLSRIEFALSFQPFLAGFPAILAICIVLLIVNLGPIALVGIGVFFASFALSLIVFKRIIKLRIGANILTDRRVTMMREILNNMKMVKYYAWEDAYEKNITDIRGQEISKVRRMQFIRNFMIALAMSLPNIASLVTFLAMYKVNHSGRTPGNVFSSLSLFQVLSLQMFFFPIAISTGIDMILGLDRIQNLLQSPEVKNDIAEEMKNLPPLSSDLALKMEHASFEWADYEKMDKEEKEQLEKESADKKKSKKKKQKEPSSPVVTPVEPDQKLGSVDLKKTAFTGFNNLNFEVKKGEFIMITGPIGTGKTSLLNAMAGVMEKINGTLQINGDLLMGGYPWIQNATVRDNITFGSPFDKAKYDRVLDACSLEADLKILPAGDMTEIGERGITLSGGQKARINLARCVYKSKDIYLFDDVLSAVDSRVGKHIMEECLLKLLQGKTRVLATHQLSLIEKASRVIVLGNDGSVDIGTVEELKRRSDTLNGLLALTTQESKEEGDDEESSEEGPSVKKNDFNMYNDKEVVQIVKQLSKKSTNAEPVNGRVTQKEERAVNSIKIKVYKQYFQAGVGKWGYLLAPFYITCVAATTFCTLFSSVWLSFWTEDKFHNRSTSFYMGLYSFFVFAGFLFMSSQFTLLCLIGVTASKWLNIKALKRILHTPMAFMDTTPLGRILNRFTKDTDSLDNELTENLRLMNAQLANIIGVCVMCIIYLPWFAIAIPFLFLVFVMVANHYQSTGREIKRLEAIQRSFVYNNLNEVLGGMETIKFYKGEERFMAKCDYLINKMNEAGYLSVCVQRWVAILLDMIAVAFALIITLLCVTRQFHISAASVGVLLTYVLQLPGLLNTVLRALTQTENDMNSAERLVSYATELPLEAAYRKPEMSPGESWPTKGEIRFENVDFAYRPGLPCVLKNFSLTVHGSEKIGICGRTGAGKSTIMSALYRLNELESGQIFIDDIDITQLGLYDLRKKLAIIPQDPVLFRGTIRKNLDPFGQNSDEELWNALVRGGAIDQEDLDEVKVQKMSEKGSHIELHKFHLDKLVEEEGANFSLGERQILALTRALVRNTKILIMDEASSSVDYDTDRKIQARVVKAFSHCTILCIAHRLKTILNYDRILVLEKGEIAEFDTPYNLYKDSESIFRSMCTRSGITEQDFLD